MNEIFDVPKVRRTYDAITTFMEDIEAHFKAGTKLTFIARNPGIQDADILISNDDLDLVIAAVEQLKKRDAVVKPQTS